MSEVFPALTPPNTYSSLPVATDAGNRSPPGLCGGAGSCAVHACSGPYTHLHSRDPRSITQVSISDPPYCPPSMHQCFPRRSFHHSRDTDPDSQLDRSMDQAGASWSVRGRKGFGGAGRRTASTPNAITSLDPPCSAATCPIRAAGRSPAVRSVPTNRTNA
eukprot:1937533-Rhodomonas_salina.2